MKFSSYYNYFYLFFCIIWGPFHTLYFPYDGAGRIIMVLSFIAWLLNVTDFRRRRDVFGSKAFWCWSLLTAFSFINVITRGIITEQSNLWFVNFNFMMPYTFLVVTMIELCKNGTKLLRVLLLSTVAYILLASPFIMISEEERMLIDEIGNMLPLSCVFLLYVTCVLQSERKLRGGWAIFVVLLLVATIIIILSGTRKAFGGFVILLVGMVLSCMKKFNLKSFMAFVIAGVILLYGLSWVMGNTLMGARLAEANEKYDVPLVSNPVINNFLMSLLGDRAFHYYLGIEQFLTNPISGIGLGHFMENTGYQNRLHTEYMVHLCENGIIGFLLLLFFYGYMISALLKKRKEGVKVTMVLFGLFTILFLNITAWTYNLPFAMAVYACVICAAYQKQELFVKTRWKQNEK